VKVESIQLVAAFKKQWLLRGPQGFLILQDIKIKIISPITLSYLDS
jgi:hypothetical protein